MFKISLIVDALKRAQEGARRGMEKGRQPDRRIDISGILDELERLLSSKDPNDLGILWLYLLCHKLEILDIKLEEDIEKALEEENIKNLVKGKFEKLEIEESWLKRDLDKENEILTELRRKIRRQNELLEELKRLLQEAEARKAVAVVKRPELIERINRELVETEGNATSIRVSSEEIAGYIKTLNLPHVSITELNLRILDSHLHIKGRLHVTLAGDVEIDAVLANSSRVAGLEVTSFRASKFSQRIEPQIANLNQVITNQINIEINPNWRLSELRLSEDNLIINFERQASDQGIRRPSHTESRSVEEEVREALKKFL